MLLRSEFTPHGMAPRVLFALLISGLTVSTSLAQLNPDATASQNNAAHDGSVTFHNFTPTPTKLWSTSVVETTLSYPVIAQGEVYVVGRGTTPGTLYAFNAATGHLDWSAGFTALYPRAPAYDNGEVFVVHNGDLSNNLLNAYDATTGQLLWDTPLPHQWNFRAPPTAYNGVVYVEGAGVGATMYALRESDGVILWQSASADPTAPAVDGTGVYEGRGGITKYDPASGAKLWSTSLSGNPSGYTEPTIYNGHVYIGSLGPGIAALDATTGQVSFTASYPSTGTFAFSAGVGFMLSSSSLTAFDAATGALLWSKTNSGDAFVTNPIVINGVVFEGTTSGKVLEFVGLTGQPIGGGVDVGAALGPANPNLGMTAGDGLLAVPAGNTLTVYSVVVPEPGTLILAILGLATVYFPRSMGGRARAA